MIKADRYHDQNRHHAGADSSFGEMLRKEQTRVHQQDEEKKEEKLRRMEGQNQYNRQAAGVFFLLSRTMDYKA